MKRILDFSKDVYKLNLYEISQVSTHNCGRNIVYVCSLNKENKYILRISILNDKEENDYLAEIEFVLYLAKNGAPVADVYPSVNNKYVECFEYDGKIAYISLFDYAKGMLISDNNYQYREGASLTEYFYNTGKALGKIHKLSKEFSPTFSREKYFEKYNTEYINSLIPDTYIELKRSIFKRLDTFQTLPINKEYFGLIHFDFNDGNYHIDMETGNLTVFDFDNCMYCWYMFDLATLWINGTGWYQFEPDITKRKFGMEQYFNYILKGYLSETEVSSELINQLQLFIDMVLIEGIIDEFEYCIREGEIFDYDDIKDEANCLINNIEYAGFFNE